MPISPPQVRTSRETVSIRGVKMCCALPSSLIQASSMLRSRVGLSAVCLVMPFFIIPVPGTTTRTQAPREPSVSCLGKIVSAWACSLLIRERATKWLHKGKGISQKVQKCPSVRVLPILSLYFTASPKQPTLTETKLQEILKAWGEPLGCSGGGPVLTRRKSRSTAALPVTGGSIKGFLGPSRFEAARISLVTRAIHTCWEKAV